MKKIKNKCGQDKKSKIFSLPFKKGQEEMVGFALIIIIVAVIILIFISLTLTKPKAEEIESYEVESFIQALLQYTTDCEYNYEYLSVEKLISRCKTSNKCLDERDTCSVLNEIIDNILNQAWKIENRPPEGYNFTIMSGEDAIISLSKGNQTGNYKGAVQFYKETDIYFRVYYP